MSFASFREILGGGREEELVWLRSDPLGASA